MSDANPGKDEINTDNNVYTVSPLSIPNLPKLTQSAKKAAPSSDMAKLTTQANPTAKKATPSSDATKSTDQANPTAKKVAPSSDTTNPAQNDDCELASDIKNMKGNEDFTSNGGSLESADSEIQMETEHLLQEHSSWQKG